MAFQEALTLVFYQYCLLFAFQKQINKVAGFFHTALISVKVTLIILGKKIFL
jgi:hypothetical protein